MESAVISSPCASRSVTGHHATNSVGAHEARTAEVSMTKTATERREALSTAISGNSVST